MNKALLFLLPLGALAVLLIVFFAPRAGAPVGISLGEPSFTAVTRSVISCSSANASTSVLVSQGALSSFKAYNVSPNQITLCRHGEICTATSGIPLYASSTGSIDLFEQVDAYAGIYTCRAEGATSSLGIQYSL